MLYYRNSKYQIQPVTTLNQQGVMYCSGCWKVKVRLNQPIKVF